MKCNHQWKVVEVEHDRDSNPVGFNPFSGSIRSRVFWVHINHRVCQLCEARDTEDGGECKCTDGVGG